MTKTAETQTAATATGEHACECGKYEIEIGHDAAAMTYKGTDCSQGTTRTFAPGHDAKLKALLIEAGANGWSVRRDEGGVCTINDAAGWAAKFDFGHMVLAGIARAGQKLAAKLDRKAAREAAKAERDASRPARTPRARKAQPEVVTIKVGRWTYAATINTADNSATFTSANGETKTAAHGKYAIVTK